MPYVMWWLLRDGGKLHPEGGQPDRELSDRMSWPTGSIRPAGTK